MSPRRIAFWMLATAGVAVGHIAGYALAHPDAAAREAALGGHAYLPGVAATVIPVGIGAALVWAVRTARDMGLAGRIDWRHLAIAQIGVFALQEIAERHAAGIGGLGAVVAERGVWFGLVAQVVVAWAVVRTIDVVRLIVRQVAFVPARRTTLAPLPLLVDTETSGFACARRIVAVGLRAPPVVGAPR